MLCILYIVQKDFIMNCGILYIIENSSLFRKRTVIKFTERAASESRTVQPDRPTSASPMQHSSISQSMQSMVHQSKANQGHFTGQSMDQSVLGTSRRLVSGGREDASESGSLSARDRYDKCEKA